MLIQKEIKFANSTLILTNKRAIYHADTKSLILSDLHLGKATHFRKNGIPISNNIVLNDLNRLAELIEFFKPIQVVVAGDFFHAAANGEIDLFKNWRKNYNTIDFILVKGNHDRLNLEVYQEIGIELIKDKLNLNDFIITHIPKIKPIDFEICGHIHPEVAIKGIGKQKLKLPCYVINEKQIILAAFSEFTGLDTSFSKVGNVYAFSDDFIIEI